MKIYRVAQFTDRTDKADIESVYDEDGNMDDNMYNQSTRLSKEVNMGITRDRELSNVITRDRKVIGALWKSFENGNYEFDIAVHPMYQNKGIGSQLVDRAINDFSEYKDMDDNATMRVHVISPIMQKLLESRGFRVVERMGAEGKDLIMERA